MHYKVSVIIPVYNAQDYLERCVDSLMSQTLQEIEYVFVEDCPTDGSHEVLMSALEKYPQRRDDVVIIRHERNMGVASSRNDGNEAATGEFLIHCDSDDWVEPTMYEKMYRKVSETGAEICICDFFMEDKEGVRTMHPKIDCSASHEKVVADYIGWVWNTLWSAMVSRNVYRRSNVRIPEKLSFTEDFYLLVQLFQNAGKITSVDEPLYHYNRQNASSIVHSVESGAMAQELYSYESIAEWMKDEGIYGLYFKQMQWRFLKATCSLVYHDRFEEFRRLHPESHRFIISVPSDFCKPKVKLMMLLTVMRLDAICRWDNHRHGRA